MSPAHLIQGASFDPETTSLMAAAFDEACRVAGQPQPPSVKEVMAKRGHRSLTRMTRLIDKYQRVPLSPLSRINLSFAERLAAACLIASVYLPTPSELFYTDAGK